MLLGKDTTGLRPINPHVVACKTLARIALVNSGVNRKTLADALGTAESTISRKLSDEHEHEFGISELLMLEALTGDRSVLDYLERELGREAREAS